MARVKITRANEDKSIRVSNTIVSADIPIDGEFHEIHDDLVGPLTDSSVEFEIENARATGGSAKAGGAAGLGGSVAPLDHDGDGKKGGSKKGAASTRSKGKAKKGTDKMPNPKTSSDISGRPRKANVEPPEAISAKQRADEKKMPNPATIRS